MRISASCVLLWAALMLVGMDRAISGIVSLRTVALSNQTAPGTTGDVHFATFLLPDLNRRGRVAFQATLTGADVAAGNNSGYWFEDGVAPALIAREGMQPPGLPAGVAFADLAEDAHERVLNANGVIAFVGRVTGPGFTSTNNTGIWSTVPGPLTLLTRATLPAPGTGSGVNFTRNIGTLHLNDSNAMAFGGRLSGSGVTSSNDQGVWTTRTGPLTLLARSGAPIPGLPGVQTFGGIGATNLNNKGQFTLQGFITGVPSSVHFVESNGRYRTLLRDGWHVEPASFMLLIFPSTWPLINDAGHVTTFSGFNAPGSTSTSFHAILSDTNGLLLPVAQALTAAPGADGLPFSGFNTHTMNGLGRVAFKAILSDPNNLTRYGIWSQGFGALTLVARGGMQAPNAPTDVNFLEPSTPWLNGMGQVAFRSTLTGPGVDSSNDVGIYVLESPGVLTAIARKGDDIEVAPGDFRTISTLEMMTNANGIVNRQFAFNDAGQLTFKATFTDGTQGLFVASVGTVFSDCNNDAIPDSCQLSQNDCNANQVPDNCEIAQQTSPDCNGNDVPDACEPLDVDLLAGGNFESGDYSGWSPSAGMVINNGDTDPPGPSGKFVPYGRFSAMNTAAAPGGLFTLLQELEIPASARTTTLIWTDEIRNYGAQFSNPLQGFRVELRSPSNQTLATLFSTQPGDPLISPLTVRQVAIPPLPGKTVRIVFVIQCAQAHMNVQIDNVKLLCRTTSDCDGNGGIDQCQSPYSDVEAFAIALTGSAPFNCLFDANQDGTLDGLDIEPFTRRITN